MSEWAMPVAYRLQRGTAEKEEAERLNVITLGMKMIGRHP